MGLGSRRQKERQPPRAKLEPEVSFEVIFKLAMVTCGGSQQGCLATSGDSSGCPKCVGGGALPHIRHRDVAHHPALHRMAPQERTHGPTTLVSLRVRNPAEIFFCPWFGG